MFTKRSLRILIIVDLVLIAVGVAIGIVSEAWLPEPLRALEQARAAADMTPGEWILVGVGNRVYIIRDGRAMQWSPIWN